MPPAAPGRGTGNYRPAPDVPLPVSWRERFSMERICAQAWAFRSSPGAALIAAPFSTGRVKDPALASEQREGGRRSQIKTPVLLIWKWMLQHHPIVRALTGGQMLFPAEKK